MDCSDAFWNESRTNTEEGPVDTKRNTAAIYVRRSAADERDADERTALTGAAVSDEHHSEGREREHTDCGCRLLQMVTDSHMHADRSRHEECKAYC